jgi:hypothetical protein
MLSWGCGDESAPTGPAAPPSAPEAAPGSIDAAAAQEVARIVALALSHAPVREQLRDAMRASKLTAHKLVLQEYVATPAGRALVAEGARLAGISTEQLATRIAALPAMDFYVPRSEHRRSWKATADVIVAALLDAESAVVTAFDTKGGRLELRESTGIPSPLVLISLAERKSRRIAAQPDRPGLVIQDADDGEVSGTLVRFLPNGDSLVVQLADLPNADKLLRTTAPSEEEMKAELKAAAPRLDDFGLQGVGTDPMPTYLGWFAVYYDTDGWIDPTLEPYVKALYLDSRHEIRYDGVRRGQMYYPQSILLWERTADLTRTPFQIELWEDDPFTDRRCTTDNTNTWKIPFYYTDNSRLRNIRCGSSNINWADVRLYWAPRETPPIASVAVGVTLGGQFGTQAFWAGCPYRGDMRAHSARGETIEIGNRFRRVWTSNNDIATATATGISYFHDYADLTVNGRRAGGVTIYAQVDGVVGQTGMTFSQFIDRVVVSPASASTTIGGSVQFTHTYYRGSTIWTRCSNADAHLASFSPLINPPEWSSSAGHVAPVNSSGLATGSSQGSATIQAFQGGVTGSATMFVNSAPPPQPLSASITGATNAPAYSSCMWFAVAQGGTPPYTYEWYHSGAYTGVHDQMYYGYTGSYSFDLMVIIRDAAGAQQYGYHYVNVDPWSGGSCGLL